MFESKKKKPSAKSLAKKPSKSPIKKAEEIAEKVAGKITKKITSTITGASADKKAAGPRMRRYKNTGGGSNVLRFCHDKSSITIEFIDGDTYLYNAKKPGEGHVAQMINLAEAGQGLYAYISRYVKKNHAAKLK